MRDLFIKMFRMSHFNTGISITAFSIPHIAYLILIFGGIVAAWFCLRNKSAEKKTKALRVMIYLVALSYFSDFFVHEFVYDGLNKDKLPFHICTVLCPLALYAQFNRNGGKIKEPVAALAVLAPMMYLCYPASVGDGEPWCYQAVQTMFYHGMLMAWGILSIALGDVKPELNRVWKSGVLLEMRNCISWNNPVGKIRKPSDGYELVLPGGGCFLHRPGGKRHHPQMGSDDRQSHRVFPGSAGLVLCMHYAPLPEREKIPRFCIIRGLS